LHKLINPDSTVLPSEFSLYVDLDGKYYSKGFDISDIFSSKAYAVSPCRDGRKGSKEKIQSFVITSDADIDSQYVAGTELNSLFKYKQHLFFSGQNTNDTSLRPIDPNFLETMRLGFGELLMLQTNRIKDSVHTFSVVIRLSNRRAFSASTFPIRFKFNR